MEGLRQLEVFDKVTHFPRVCSLWPLKDSLDYSFTEKQGLITGAKLL